jgi:hypothetical protein
MMNREMPIGAAIALLKKEIADRQSALSVLEALVAQGVQAGPSTTASGTAQRARRGGKKLSVGKASVEILRAAGRPMHGGRELIPALEAQGYRIKHKGAGMATTLLRTGEIERTSPGTFAFKGGNAAASH